MTSRQLDHLRWLLAGAQFLLLVDTSVINVALPSIAQALAFPPSAQSWISHAYLILFGSALLLAGRLADVYGKPRLFTGGLWTLLAGSAVAAMAHSPAMLILGRAVQGLGAAMTASASLALVFALYEGEARQRTLGLLAAMAGAGGAAGTALGGLLTEAWGWPAIFWISALAALLLIALARGLGRLACAAGPREAIDYAGACLLILGQAALAWGLLAAADRQMKPALLGLAIALLALSAFFAWRRRSPLLPTAIWRNRPLMRANLLAATSQAALFPMFLIVNFYLQDVLRVPPLQSGLALLPLCAVVILTAGLAPRAISRIGLNASLAGGFGLIALGLGWMSRLQADGSFWIDVLGPSLIIGAGLPIVAIASNMLAGLHTREGEEGISAGLLNTAQQFGSIVGLAALLGIASAATRWRLAAGLAAPQALSSGYAMALLCAAILAAAAAAHCLGRKGEAAAALAGG